jgi:hypothetical protein
MTIFKKIMNWFYPPSPIQIIAKEKPKEPITNIKNNPDTIFDVIISLTKNKKINITIFIQDKAVTDINDIFQMGDNCGELLHLVNSGKLGCKIHSLLQDQIKNEDNQLLIDNIVSAWDLHDKEFIKRLDQKDNQTFILPSNVFANYTK